MSDLVGNPEDRFSHKETHICYMLYAGKSGSGWYSMCGECATSGLIVVA